MSIADTSIKGSPDSGGYRQNLKSFCSRPANASSFAPREDVQSGRNTIPSIPLSAISFTSRARKSPHVLLVTFAWAVIHPSGDASAAPESSASSISAGDTTSNPRSRSSRAASIKAGKLNFGIPDIGPAKYTFVILQPLHYANPLRLRYTPLRRIGVHGRIERDAVIAMRHPEILARRLEPEIIVGGVLIVPLQAAVTTQPSCQHTLVEVPKLHDIVVLSDRRVACVLLLLTARHRTQGADNTIAATELITVRQQTARAVDAIQCIRAIGDIEFDALVFCERSGQELIQQPSERRVIAILRPDFLRVAIVITRDTRQKHITERIGRQLNRRHQLP